MNISISVTDILCEISYLYEMQRHLVTSCKNEQSDEIDYRLEMALQYEDSPVNVLISPDILEPFAHLCCFGKSIIHDKDGNLDRQQFRILLDAIFQDSKKFAQLKLGGQMKLVCPSCIHSYEILGAPKWSYEIRNIPSIKSARVAGEMVELYWMSILRDVPFSQWNTHPLALAAVQDLNRLSDFEGPKINGMVTSTTLFRGGSEGDLIGPYLSQFLLMPFKQGIAEINQKYRFYHPGLNYLTDKEEVIRVLNGNVLPAPVITGMPRFIGTLRDGASYVHVDEPMQSFENASRILLGMKAPTNPGNPYLTGLKNETPFVDFGIVDIHDLLHRVSRVAALATWFFKWTLLRLRPEELSLLLERIDNGDPIAQQIPIHSDWFNSIAKSYIKSQQGNVLLTTTYKEGSPAHPAYPSGHAVFAGAGATILKAFFDNDTVIASIRGQPLKLHHELDKLASNIASFRNAAGIHYRSDMEDGILLGEQVAIRFLQEEVRRYPNAKYIIKKRDGSLITISA